MAKQTLAGSQKPKAVERMRVFFQEVKIEMAKVAWPTKDEVKSSTSIVLLLLGIMAGIVGIYDVLFQYIMMQLLKLGAA